MSDEQIERALRAGPPDEPAYADIAAARARVVRRTMTAGWSNKRIATILAAALIVSTLAVVGPLRRPSTDSASSDPLGTIRAAGRIRIAVTNGPPQVQVPGAGEAGFDLDVANAVGARLGIPVEVSLVDPAEVERGGWGDRWDLALDSVPSTTRRSTTLSIGSGYYARPGVIIAPVGSGLTSVTGLAGSSVCVVAGGLAERWLAGGLDLIGGSSVAVPASVTAVIRPDPAGCLTALEGGAAAAFAADWRFDLAAVPAGLTEAPDPPFVAVAAVAADPARAAHGAILAEVDRIIAGLRADGTLRSLSERRFGGTDVTILPAH